MAASNASTTHMYSLQSESGRRCPFKELLHTGHGKLVELECTVMITVSLCHCVTDQCQYWCQGQRSANRHQSGNLNEVEQSYADSIYKLN